MKIFKILAISIGVPLGLVSAYRRNSPVDVGTMMLANLGVSMPVFVLGLVLAFLFAIILKDTPFSLPPSGRLSSGVSIEPLTEVWGLQGWTGPPRGFLDFLSGIYIPTALITGQALILILIGIVFVASAASVLLQIGYFKLTGGQRLFRMSPLHHHFELIGWDEEKITMRYWIVAILASMLGVVLFLATVDKLV